MTDDEKTLAFDPFQGDFGDQGDTVLKNKMGVARKAGEVLALATLARSKTPNARLTAPDTAHRSDDE